MTDESHPIAYTALLPGTSVQTSDGQEFGRVERVLVDDKVDVFDGIVVRTTDGTRFVDADQVGQIFTSHVCTTVSTDEVARLPVLDHDPARRGDGPDAGGSSFGARIGRMFGRGKST
jgi:sporulation protein YlmC with PRC-barrel domain